jgi:protein-disulfide isomerase
MEGENTGDKVQGDFQQGQSVPPSPNIQQGAGDTVSFQIKKDNIWKYSTFVLAIVVVIGAIMMFTGDGGTPTGAAVGAPAAPTPSAPTAPSQVTASADDDAVLGDENAPVTIIEFSDYQCPFCGRFWSDTLPQIKSEYIDTGKAKLVYRDFPLTSIHPLAQPAAEATECVREQGGDEAFYQYHDKIFANQQALSQPSLIAWADELGYDINECLSSGKFRGEVQKDTSDAQAAGGRGTPYFVINGKPLSGAQPFSAFQQIIEAEL